MHAGDKPERKIISKRRAKVKRPDPKLRWTDGVESVLRFSEKEDIDVYKRQIIRVLLLLKKP